MKRMKELKACDKNGQEDKLKAIEGKKYEAELVGKVSKKEKICKREIGEPKKLVEWRKTNRRLKVWHNKSEIRWKGLCSSRLKVESQFINFWLQTVMFCECVCVRLSLGSDRGTSYGDTPYHMFTLFYLVLHLRACSTRQF